MQTTWKIVRLVSVFALLVNVTNSPCSAQSTWRRTYGGLGADDAKCVRQLNDGGYVVVGNTGSFGNGSSDIYCLYLDHQGDVVWSRTYGGIGVDNGVVCRELSDGLLIAGSSSNGYLGGYDMVLIKTDHDGNLIWQKYYGTSEWDLCNGAEVIDSGFLLTGITYGGGNPSGAAYLVRTDLNGDTLWTRVKTGSLGSEGYGITSTYDEGIVVAGESRTVNGSTDAFLTKYDVSGDEIWTAYFGGDSADGFKSVYETMDGDLVACGSTRSYMSVSQILLVGANSSGQPIWQELIGNTADAGGAEIRPDHNSGSIFTGYNTLNLGSRDMILTSTYYNGFFEAGSNFGNGRPADGYSVDTTNDGGYVVAGWAENFGPGTRAVYVVKTDSLLQTGSTNVFIYSDPLKVPLISEPILPVYPNPVRSGGILQFPNKSGSALQLKVSDMLGRIVYDIALRPSQVQIVIPILPNGMYRLMLYGNPVPTSYNFIVSDVL